MSSIISSTLRRVCQRTRVPVLRQVSTCSAMTRVMGESQVSRVQSQLLSPVVVSGQQQLRAYSGADPLNMKFINDRLVLLVCREKYLVGEASKVEAIENFNMFLGKLNYV